jgi:hypothetical protein
MVLLTLCGAIYCVLHSGLGWLLCYPIVKWCAVAAAALATSMLLFCLMRH